jgi:hypothetical protein
MNAPTQMALLSINSFRQRWITNTNSSVHSSTTKFCFYSQTTYEFKRQSFNFGHPDVLTVTNSEANTDSRIPLTSHLIYTRV